MTKISFFASDKPNDLTPLYEVDVGGTIKGSNYFFDCEEQNDESIAQEALMAWLSDHEKTPEETPPVGFGFVRTYIDANTHAIGASPTIDEYSAPTFIRKANINNQALNMLGITERGMSSHESDGNQLYEFDDSVLPENEPFVTVFDEDLPQP